jgi:hypothetical protein
MIYSNQVKIIHRAEISLEINTRWKVVEDRRRPQLCMMTSCKNGINIHLLESELSLNADDDESAEEEEDRRRL